MEVFDRRVSASVTGKQISVVLLAGLTFIPNLYLQLNHERSQWSGRHQSVVRFTRYLASKASLQQGQPCLSTFFI